MVTRLKFAAVLVVALAGLLTPMSSFADSILFQGSGGNASFNGSVFSITGGGISSVSINGGAPVNILNGVLTLTTAVASNVTGCIGGSCSAIFPAGGSITIVGNGGMTLLSGTYLASAPGQGFSVASPNFVLGTFAGSLDPNLFLDPSIASGLVTQGSNAEVDLNLNFLNGTYSGNVLSSSAAITTPEPGTLLLSTIGMAGLFLLKRRFV